MSMNTERNETTTAGQGRAGQGTTMRLYVRYTKKKKRKKRKKKEKKKREGGGNTIKSKLQNLDYKIQI